MGRQVIIFREEVTVVRKLESCDITKHVDDDFAMLLRIWARFDPHPEMMHWLRVLELVPAAENSEVQPRSKSIIVI